MSGPEGEHLRLERWTVTSGSNVQSRGAVVLGLGELRWDGAAEGNGPVDALIRAVDQALGDVLEGHPRLVEYTVRAVAEGPDAEGLVTVRIEPPPPAGPAGPGRDAAAAVSARAEPTRFGGSSQSPNIIAASVEAYVEAVDQLLAATGALPARTAALTAVTPIARRGQLDEDGDGIDTTSWFER